MESGLFPTYYKRFNLGLIKCPCHPKYSQNARAVGLLDGDQGFGHFVGHTGMLKAIERAQDEGIGMVGVHNSNHFGAAGYYVHLTAERGMIGITMSNSFPRMAPYGGVKPVFGTNPFAFGAPRRNGKSLLLDMASSATSGAAVRRCANEGGQLPEGVAMDSQGRPATEPSLLGQSTLLPFAGAKGYGVALMIEILSGVITGAGISGGVKSMFENFKDTGENGHMFIAIDVKTFMPLDVYYERFEFLESLVKSSGREVEGEEVLLPGETRWKIHEKTQTEGISLEHETVLALQELANRTGIAVPWQEVT